MRSVAARRLTFWKSKPNKNIFKFKWFELSGCLNIFVVYCQT
nr:hypothetical protein [Alysiella crassa]